MTQGVNEWREARHTYIHTYTVECYNKEEGAEIKAWRRNRGDSEVEVQQQGGTAGVSGRQESQDREYIY